MTAAARMVNLVAAIVSKKGHPDPRMGFEALEQGLTLSCGKGQIPGPDGITVSNSCTRRMTGFQTSDSSTVQSCGRKCPQKASTTILSYRPGGLVCSCLCSPGKLLSAFPLSRGSVAFLQQALQLTLSSAVSRV